MNYTVLGLDSSEFTHLYGQSDDYLAAHQAVRVKAQSESDYPDRIALRNVPVGENAILVNHVYQPAKSPYFGRHAIFIHEGASGQGRYENEVPEYLFTRQISLRAFNEAHMIIAAHVAEGADVENLIFQLFANAQTSYIHAHSARFGCYMCAIKRQ
ncbi:hypothetical protein BTJ39_05680 [Izhakiella australiensis]|uniref:DUF1203 domain-containing protein n=1 Tax=Izhakiella australiensis TaxID=1926881 RepID=A0A1S8YRN2_9GAMM|nr:DUF1203 domain-containing protein [Izhakiella australiensis]OON41447.1 hypothetical protein BTJ39_05680 [Izhakiella australiensis]